MSVGRSHTPACLARDVDTDSTILERTF